jgi:hypothetical protein
MHLGRWRAGGSSRSSPLPSSSWPSSPGDCVSSSSRSPPGAAIAAVGAFTDGSGSTGFLEAEGEAEAVRKVFAAIHEGQPTNDLLAIKYLEDVAGDRQRQATKIFLPTEATALLGALGGMAEMLQGPPKASTNGSSVRRDAQNSTS